MEVQTDPMIPPNNVTVYLTINVTDISDPPVIFLSLWGDSILPPDPTEPVIVSYFPFGKPVIVTVYQYFRKIFHKGPTI
jgi:hypothetical protein